MDVDRSKNSFAGPRSRVFAFALDYLLICGYILVVTTISTFMIRGPLRQHTDSLFATPTRRDLIAFLTLILPVTLYFTYCESSHHQATWGKRKVGVFVTDRHGGRLSRSRAFARSALKFAPWQVAHTSLFHIPGWPLASTTVPPLAQGGLSVGMLTASAYLLSIIIDKQHRALFDRVTGSMVLKKEP